MVAGASLLAALALACWIDVTLERAVASTCIVVLLGAGAAIEWNRFFARPGGTYGGLLLAAAVLYPALEAGRILCEWRAPWLDALFLSGFLALLYVRAVLGGEVGAGLDRVGRTLLGFATVFLFYRLVPVLLLADEGGGISAGYALAFTAKSCDIGAYLTGSLAGKHRLIPRVSPGKTVEGAAGGLVLSTAVGAVAMAWIGRGSGFGALFGLLVGAGTMFGDLAESLAKRCAGVKDSGSVVPASGGILDLIDSFILAAPVGYVLLILV